MALSASKRIFSSTVVRFGVLGVVNTGIDFVLFNILLAVAASNPPSRAQILLLNSISATAVAIWSFVINRKYVFDAQHTPHHYALYFVLVTLSGLYLLQTSIIFLTVHSLGGVGGSIATALQQHGLTTVTSAVVLANLGKVFATAASMLWNFLWYKYVIFK